MNYAFLWRRLWQLVVAVFAIATFNFLLLSAAPGDAAEVLAGQGGHATPEYVAELKAEFGIDRPIAERYLTYLRKTLSLDLGYSPLRKASVADLILDRLPATMLLVFSAIFMAVSIGVLTGIVTSLRRGSWFDTAVSVGALVFFATPSFWLGLMLVIVFSLWLDWFPLGGMETIGADLQGWKRATDVAWHLVLPTLTMALYYLAIYARLMRASMLEVLGLDYIRTARAKGLTEGRIAIQHGARNALLPVVTIAVLQIGHFMGGAILVETIFSWPGLGRLVYDALVERDINLLMGIFFLSSVVVILTSFVADMLYRRLDPRIV